MRSFVWLLPLSLFAADSSGEATAVVATPSPSPPPSPVLFAPKLRPTAPAPGTATRTPAPPSSPRPAPASSATPTLPPSPTPRLRRVVPTPTPTPTLRYLGDRSRAPAAGEPKVTLDLKDADLRDVLDRFANLTGLDFVVYPEVRGVVTCTFQDVPWETALDLILKSNGLAFERDRGVVLVGPPGRFTK